MKRVEVLSYPVSIFIAGDYHEAAQICSDYCNAIGLCVTINRTVYIYTGGTEDGVVVGLINYGRFPAEPRTIWFKAEELAKALREGLGQESFTIQAPDKTAWFSYRDRDRDPEGAETVQQGSVERSEIEPGPK